MMESLITQHTDLWTSAIEAKSTAGRGSKNKFDLYGIKKLRELILELAVRGKLVPQKLSDQPVGTLLENIAFEKTLWVKNGTIKQPKAISKVGISEQQFVLPQSWEWSRISELCYLENGDRSKNYPNKSKLVSTGIPFVNAGQLNACRISKNDLDFISQEHFDILNGGKFVDGDILFCLRGSLGKCALVKDFGKGAIASSLIIIRAYLPQMQNYLMMVLSSPLTSRNISKFDNGTAQPNLSGADLSKFCLPLPPLEEQDRIVAKVDELMALCDQLEQQTLTSIDAHATLVETLLETLTNSADAAELEQNWARISEHFDTLFTTEQSIDALKQTILQLAVMGKLVRQDPTDEPASVLLEKIAAEKAQLIKDKKIKKEKPLPPISDEEKPFELPQGWEWCRIWDIAHTITSGSRDWAKYYSDTGAKFITMGNLSRGDYKLRMDTIRYVNPPSDGEGLRTKLEANDLLISITGDVGNLGLIPTDFGDAYINQHTCMLRFITPCRNLFFPNMMRSPWAKYQFDAPQRGIKNSFRLGDVGEMLIPLPPLEEQYRIVDKIEKLLSLCESIKWKLNTSISIQLHLTDAIVDKALS